MKKSQIQWTDDTVNPTMGCDGCPLWPSVAQICGKLIAFLVKEIPGHPDGAIASVVNSHLRTGLDATHIYREKKLIVRAILQALDLAGNSKLLAQCLDVLDELFKCYAGHITVRYAGHNPGYPDSFDVIKLFPGRMAIAAAARDLTGTKRAEKPWLNDLPRLIFVSDMGDSLSQDVSFDYLHDEIIQTVNSPKGQRHIWLWLTKRPRRMAEFADWLFERGLNWPQNLIPMTSILNERMSGAALPLADIHAPVRGLSVEPLWTPVTLPLKEARIGWVIVGGESGKFAAPFNIAWARDIRDQCLQAGIPFFLKQLGSNPVLTDGTRLRLHDGHGGDWREWPIDLRIREMPKAFLPVPVEPRPKSQPYVKALAAHANTVTIK